MAAKKKAKDKKVGTIEVDETQQQQQEASIRNAEIKNAAGQTYAEFLLDCRVAGLDEQLANLEYRLTVFEIYMKERLVNWPKLSKIWKKISGWLMVSPVVLVLVAGVAGLLRVVYLDSGALGIVYLLSGISAVALVVWGLVVGTGRIMD